MKSLLLLWICLKAWYNRVMSPIQGIDDIPEIDQVPVEEKPEDILNVREKVGDYWYEWDVISTNDRFTLHTTKVLYAGGETVMTFRPSKMQSNKPTPFIEDLLLIPGITLIFLNRYEVTIHRGGAFRWEEMLPVIQAVVLTELEREEQPGIPI